MHTSSYIIHHTQSSYLSQISQIIFMEKKLSCGEILGNIGKIWETEKFWKIFGKFWKNFGKFWEILPQVTRFHVEKN